MILLPRLGPLQIDALWMYVFEDIHDEDDFPGWLVGRTLYVTDRERARDLLADAANSADDGDDGSGKRPDVEFRSVFERLQRRLRNAPNVSVAALLLQGERA